MRSTTFIGAAVAAVSAAAASLTINSPASLTACRPTLLSWTAGGGGPYYISAVGDSNPSNILEQIVGPTTDTTFTWVVDLNAGQNVSIGVSDNTGATAYTASVIVTAGSGSCSVASGSASASSAAGGASSSAAGASSSAGSATSSAAGKVSSATSAAKAGASSVASSATSAAAAAASSAAGSTSGAGAVRAGAAGLLGAAAVAVFAL